MFDMILAEIPIRIHNRFSYVERQCHRYQVEQAEPFFEVTVSDAELAWEEEVSEHQFSQELCESTAIYRKICNEIIRWDVFLMHSAVIAVDGVAYAFAARSGVGKSTHTAFWMKHFGDRAMIVNGDKPLYRLKQTEKGRELIVYGTPWCGKEHLETPVGVPLGAVCFLERGEENRISRVEPASVLPRFFQQIYLPPGEEQTDRVMSLLDIMVSDIPLYRLQCLPNEEAALTAYDAMHVK